MSDRYVEKSFLYLLVLSVLLHLAAYQLISLIPAEKVREGEKTTMVDLADLPELPVPKAKPAAPPQAGRERRASRVARAPRARESGVTRRSAAPPPAQTRAQQPRVAEGSPKGLPALPRESTPHRAVREQGETEPVRRGEGIFRPGSAEGIDRSRLFPSAGRMARLEEDYRARYRREVQDGETRFLNTEDVQFGSFLRRLEIAVYGAWRYPEAALAAGIEGTTPVRITFSRDGEIVQVEVLESSGSRILDDEVLRTLKQLGPIGSLPRGYSGDRFKLIAFFHYGNGSGRLR